MSAVGEPVANRTLDAVLPDATHGSFCPKMCAHSCPVLAATGREATNPWGLHRSVLGVGRGRGGEDVYRALHGCTGCHACQRACLYDLDVPGEVRAARATLVADDAAPPEVRRLVHDVGAGRSPYGATPAGRRADDPDVRVVLGCADGPEVAAAVIELFDAAGLAADVVVPEGCCGGILDDLGARESAAAARRRLRDRLGGGVPVATTDPHCLPSLRAVVPGVEVRHVVAVLAELHEAGTLAFSPGAPVAYHDPCVLARDEGLVAEPRALLHAAADRVVEPEASGLDTACSGAGMAFDLLAPDDAGTVADRRAAQLVAAGERVVTACARSERLLAAAGTQVTDLVVLLAQRLATGQDGQEAT